MNQKLDYIQNNVFTNKVRIIQLNIHKRTDKCHKTYIQNNYILALINSPQLDTLFILKQSQENLKKKDDNQRITNQQVFKTENLCTVQSKTYTTNTYLPISYNDNI